MNSEEQRAHWDLKYEQGLTALTQADPFFISAYGQFVAKSFPNAGVALDLAAAWGDMPYGWPAGTGGSLSWTFPT